MPQPRKTVMTPNGPREGVVIGITSTHENFNEYMLEDGTVMKMKTIVSEVLREDGAWDRDGNPVYYVKSQNVLSVDSPEELRRKGT